MTGMQMAAMAAGARPLSAQNSPPATYNQITGGGNIVSDPVTCTPSGGIPGYTYAWAYVSGDIFNIDSPTSATTTFTRIGGGINTFIGIYSCTVTDAASGVVVSTPDVEITLERT